MTQSPLGDVISHWHQLIENFQTSATGFYDAVEEALERRNIPELKTSRVDSYEGGVLSPQREYLRVHGEHHCFDMCAAPFGNGYFFSSWVTGTKARFVVLYYILFLVASFVAWQLSYIALGVFWPRGMEVGSPLDRMATVASVLTIPLAILVVLWGVALLARGGIYGAERAMLTIPIIGWFYQRTFAPPTYYRLDTMYMFQSAVESAMQEVLNGLLTAKGLRALGEKEGKPVFSELVKRSGDDRQTPEDESRRREETEELEPDGRLLLAMSQRDHRQ
jgi:hypothetical protein